MSFSLVELALRIVGIAAASLIALAVAVDPFTYATYFSYDDLERPWWKPVIAAIDAGIIMAAGILLWRRNPRAASHVAFVDILFAATLGLAIGHGDLIRIALDGWVPAQIMLLFYFVTLLLRVLVAAVAVSERASLSAPAT